VTTCVPRPVDVVPNTAWPVAASTAAVPIGFPSTKKVTIPVGLPAPGLTGAT